MADLPDPDLLAAEIVEDRQAALEQFRVVTEELGSRFRQVVDQICQE